MDDGTALLFSGMDLSEIVKTQRSAGAFRIGAENEEALEARELAPVGVHSQLLSIEEYRATKRAAFR